MTFARPEYLWLLAAVPACLVFGLLAASRRRRIAALRPDLSLPSARRRVKAAAFLAGLACVALAAAGPGSGRETVAALPVTPLRLVVALDCSRSMLARDLRPDRLGAAKALVLDVLSRLPGVEAGLVGFAGRAWLACPVTADRAGLAVSLDALSPAEAPLGGTNLPAALEAARLALAGAGPGAGAVVVVSDGEDTASGRQASAPIPASVRGDAPVFTVAVGGATPAPVPLPKAEGGLLRDAEGRPVLAGVDAAGLADLAGRNRGRTFRLSPDAPDPAVALATALAALVPPEPATRPAAPSADRTEWFLLAGFAILLLDLGLSPAGRAVFLLLLAFLALCGPALAGSRAGEGLDRGLAAYAAGRYGQARDAFLAARVWDPDRPEILFAIGAADYRLGRFEAARTYFARAGEGAVSPGLRAKALYNQGNAAYRLGDVDAAMKLYEATLALDPADADARANLDWLRSRQAPPPAGQSDKDGPQKPGHGNPDPEAGQGGKAKDGESGQAPSPQAGTGDDHGRGGDRNERQATAGASDPNREEDPAAPAVAVPAPQGEKIGEKRAATAGAASDPILDRIPDLPGLPEAPAYGRPDVEKDW
uniref:Tetratricopeptide repeat protein,von Willebrand factor type A-like protein n=1 Tax=Desulfovibrio sp. U5L TaxID=596152 RepID=I2Q5R2_9BACT